MITKHQLSKLKGWHYPSISTHEVMKMSGWKFYVFGEDIDDSHRLGEILTPIVKKYDLTMKIATQDIINRNTKRKSIAWSMAVIYLNAELFEEDQVGNLVRELKAILEDYPKKGVVVGAASIDEKIHYRYDLSIPMDPVKGVEYEEYVKLYRGEEGDFNIPHNQDIKLFFKL